jgi:selenocysteine lyase/cysteine desulfurase
MFEATDRTTVEAAASAMNEGLLHQLLDPSVTAGALSASACGDMCSDLAGLLQFILTSPLQGEEFWAAFQKQFGFASVADRVTPMNAANLCPEPLSLLNTANQLRLSYNVNLAQQVRMAQGIRVQQLELARSLLAQGVGLSDPHDLAIVRNASEANNAVSCGFRNWRSADGTGQRDNVVLWSENHPTNLEAWKLRSEWNQPEATGGLFDIHVVSFDPAASDDAITRAFTDKIDQRTRFVSYSAISNASGFRIPDKVNEGIWKHVQDKHPDCHVHIDGTMAWGARQVNLSQPYCHSFVSSAHKWFLGPKETGVFFMSKDKVKNFTPSIFAYDYKITIGRWQDMPDTALRFELLGQRDDVNIISLAATQIVRLALGPREPYQRVAELGQYLIDLLDQSKGRWQLVTPHDPDRRWGVIRVHAPRDGRPASLYNWLYDAPEYRISGSGDDKTFRLCPHIYNTKADIERAVKGMNAWYDLKR